jgi:hypothetical protein
LRQVGGFLRVLRFPPPIKLALQDTFSSWEEQNMHDTQFIIDYFKNSSVVIIGDLNTGPKIG